MRDIYIEDFDPRMSRSGAERFRDALHGAVHGPEGAFLNFITVEQLYGADTRLFMARDGDTTAAIARLDFANRDKAFVTSVFVAAEYRKRGLGQAIVQAVIAHADKLQLPRVNLVLRVLGVDLLPSAKRVYERLGFALQCGVDCFRLGDGADEAHLWSSCDDGGTIRTRSMVLDLGAARRAMRDAA
ncbi:MAG: GNAT family N-acetyltransferase [Nitrospiraceae bacterium]|nr:GNAT family N-acetyltransferase [Nitrospiraceae bacterium]